MTLPQATELPAECLLLGFDGYAAAGYRPPRETVWRDHVRELLLTVGCHMVSNMSNAMNSGIPDVTLHTNCAILFLELKGLNSPVRQNQALVAKTYNSKSLYTRGELCCFVYRAPDLLGILRPDTTIVEIANVDALSDPAAFMSVLYRASQPVVRGTETEAITELINEAGLVKVPLCDFKVNGNLMRTYTSGLALKQTTGLTALSALATYGEKPFDCEIIEIHATDNTV